MKPTPETYLGTAQGYNLTTSPKFAGLSTSDALLPLFAEGYSVTSHQAKRCRTEDRAPYVAHVVRLTHYNLENKGEYRPEIILRNGNDGTASFTLLAGMFRFACSNGIVVGATASAIRVRHIGDKFELANRILAGAEEVTKYLPKLHDKVREWQGLTLDQAEQDNLLNLASIARWGKAEGIRRSSAISHLSRYGVANRYADVGNDLWRTFNRTQEHLTRGVLGNRFGSIRALRGLDSSIRFNRTLWNIADATAKGKLEQLHSACWHQNSDIHTTARELALAS